MRFFPLRQVKGDFVLTLALAGNNLSVFSPQGPTESQRTLLGPLVLLLRAPGIATNIVSQRGKKEAGTQPFTGTVSDEATSEMGYPAWPAGRTCNFNLFVAVLNKLSPTVLCSKGLLS